MTTITIKFCSHVSKDARRAFILNVRSIVKGSFAWAYDNIYPETCVDDCFILHCDRSLSFTCEFVSKLNVLTLKSEGIFIDSLFYH